MTIAAEVPDTTVERLSERGLVLRSLPGRDAVRASVHAYNTREEIDALLKALAS